MMSVREESVSHGEMLRTNGGGLLTWRVGVGKHQTSIPEGRGISDEDSKAVADSIISDPIEDLRRCVHLDIPTGGHHNQTQGCEDNADQISSRATQDVENLSQGQPGNTTNDATYNANGGSE